MKEPKLKRDLVATHIIKKVKGGYSVFDHTGKKRLSKPSSKKAATERLRQIEYFKDQPDAHAKQLEARICASKDNKLRTKIAKVKIATMGDMTGHGEAIDLLADETPIVEQLDPTVIIQTLLEDRLVDSAALLQHFRQAHWNIKGESFAAWHEFFDRALYQSASIIDRLAERLVTLGGYADALLGETALEHALPNYPKVLDVKDHLAAIYDSLATFVTLVHQSAAIAASADEATNNLMIEIELECSKLCWQVQAGLEGGTSALQTAMQTAKAEN